MATPIKQKRNATRTSVSISGPAYMVAVGGAPRGSKPKTTNPNYSKILPRYLTPSTGSCHDLCKHGNQDEPSELKIVSTRSGSRKKSVVKNNGPKRSVVPVERNKITKTKKPTPSPNPKIRSPVESTKRENSLKSQKSRLNGQRKEKNSKANHTGSLPKNHKTVSPSKDQNRMTKNKLKQLIAKKIQEMTKTTLKEGETAELEFVPRTRATEATDFTNSESSQSSSDKQVSNLESEEVDNQDDDYKVVICEDEEDGGLEVKFRRGRVLELEDEDNGPTWLKFRRGTELDNEDEECIGRIRFKKVVVDETVNETNHETVTLKHQEMQEKKEAQELLNRVIEETASKLVEDRKTRVGALVGAFETVISLQEDNNATSTES